MTKRNIFKRYQFIALGVLLILIGISAVIHYIDSKADVVIHPFFHYVTGKVTIIDNDGKVIGPASTQQIIIGNSGASINDDGTFAFTTKESGCLDVNFIGKTTRTLNQYQIADTYEQTVCYYQDDSNPVINLNIIAVQ